MTPAEIRQLFETAGSVSLGQDGTIVSPEAMSELLAAEEARRTAALQQVLVSVRQYWLSGSSNVDSIAEILGDSSRDASWRAPIGNSGLLDFFLGILAVDGLRQSLKIHTLRTIGNSCADEDENRARVVASNSLGRIVSLLQDDSILAFVIPVLYNICVDYEPAQLQACQAQLSRALISIVSSPRLVQCRAFLNIICKIFGLLVAQEAEVTLADPATPTYLLQLAVNPDSALDIEEFCILVSVALAYLAHEPFQEELIRQEGVQALLTSFSDSCTKYDVAQMDPEDAEEYKSLSSGFMSAIADVVALPSFLDKFPLNSRPVLMLQSWVSNGYSNVNLRTTGCIALGNLARSDQSSTYFVHDVKIHVPLISFLSKTYAIRPLAPDATTHDTPPSPHLVYAIISFLKNLAIPAANKSILGTLLEPPNPVLPRMWTATDIQPQVQFAAVSLTRLLILNCPVNVRRICSPLSPDPASPAHDKSNLNVLMSLFKRTDAEHTKMEAARAAAAVCRVFHMTPDIESVLPGDWDLTEASSVYSGSTQATGSTFSSSEPSPNTPGASTASPDKDNSSVPATEGTQSGTTPLRRARFYSVHMDIADCFTYLITQTRFPALRSEIWFVSAIMSRSTDGAQLVMRCLQPFEACRALVEAVSGRDLIEGHRLAGGASLLSDDELLTMTDSTGAPVSLPLAPVSQNSALQTTDASATTAPSFAIGGTGIDGLGLEPQQADPAQLASMARIDRENGLVLIAEIIKNYAHFLPPFRRGVFEQLLQTGGALVLSARSEATSTM
ncbi:gtp binding protein [Ophiostoma piceae UAMH 11346]|uniref:Gtp binding protein n=1 Tax=Ophiostoma piceae (strain UAMH 11346) TaxID=1262450 RepID=S3C1F2_OPHP1|nr:gtp binding protein [Ophiostoma piceae UAMH 11346]